jgi:hypothetical protein
VIKRGKIALKDVTKEIRPRSGEEEKPEAKRKADDEATKSQ